MKVENRKISDLKPAEYNPRQLTDKQYKQLRKSLKTFGCVEPVVVNSNPMRKDVIIGGHQRCKVWRDLGNDTIPTIEIELGEAEEMELNVRLNKNTGQFDFDILANYYDADELKEWGFEAFEFGEVYDDGKPIDEATCTDKAFKIEIEFNNEIDQKNLYNELIEKGYLCHISM